MTKTLTKSLQIMLSKEEFNFLEELREKAHNRSKSSFGRHIILTFIERMKVYNNERKN